MKILITGASGLLGNYLMKNAPDPFKIQGIYNQFNPNVRIPRFIHCNISKKDDLTDLLNDLKPDIVIHTAAESSIDFCEKDPQYSFEINVKATENIARWCQREGKQMLFTSSDLVFDGNNAPYYNSDIPNPLNQYALQKAEAEKLIQGLGIKSIICRLPLLIGTGWPDKKSSFQNLVTKLKNGQGYRFFTDEFRTPAYAKNVAQGIYRLLENQLNKAVFHFGGRQSISRYELGLMIAKAFQIDTGLIVPVKQKDLDLSVNRPKDVSLKSDDAYQAGYDPDDLANALQELKNEME